MPLLVYYNLMLVILYFLKKQILKISKILRMHCYKCYHTIQHQEKEVIQLTLQLMQQYYNYDKNGTLANLVNPTQKRLC